MFHRRGRLRVALVFPGHCLHRCLRYWHFCPRGVYKPRHGQPAQQQTPAQPPPARQPNPFENVPTAPGSQHRRSLPCKTCLRRRPRPREQLSRASRPKTSSKPSNFAAPGAFARIHCRRSSLARRATSTTKRRCTGISSRFGTRGASTTSASNASPAKKAGSFASSWWSGR